MQGQHKAIWEYAGIWEYLLAISDALRSSEDKASPWLLLLRRLTSSPASQGQARCRLSPSTILTLPNSQPVASQPPCAYPISTAWLLNQWSVLYDTHVNASILVLKVLSIVLSAFCLQLTPIPPQFSSVMAVLLPPTQLHQGNSLANIPQCSIIMHTMQPESWPCREFQTSGWSTCFPRPLPVNCAQSSAVIHLLQLNLLVLKLKEG